MMEAFNTGDGNSPRIPVCSGHRADTNVVWRMSRLFALLLFAFSMSANAIAGSLLAELAGANPPPVFNIGTVISDLRLYLNTDSGHLYSQYSNYPWEDVGPDLGNGNRGVVGQVMKQSDGSEVMVFNFSNLRLTVSLTIYGARPAVIMSSGSILIDAPVVVRAGGGVGGTSASAGSNGGNAAGATGGAGGIGRGGVCIVSYYPWGWDWAYAGGGGGGGFVSKGEDGATGHVVNCQDGRVYQYAGGAGGTAFTAWSSILSGGGGGGAGGSGTTWGGYHAGGGTGGNGGGAVLFVTSGDFTITANGSIRADGAHAPYMDGGSGEGSGGGGAGGYIAFNIGGRWHNDGIVSAHGGNGSWGAVFHPDVTAPSSARDQMGGEGSGGFIAVNSAEAVNTRTMDVSSGALGVTPVGGRVLLNAGSIFNTGQITGPTGSANSALVATSTVTNSTTVPGAPKIGTVSPANGSATVNFAGPDNNGGAAITGYSVISSPGGIVASGSTSPITVTGLANGVVYTFTVKATNANGMGAASATSNSVTPSTGPGAPTIGAVSAGNGSATVNFTPPTDNGGSAITSYTVVASPSPEDPYYYYRSSARVSGIASPITVTGLSNGVPYTFTITATNATGTSSPSTASGSVTPATIPTTLPAPSAVPGNASATISFSTLVGQAVSGYSVNCSAGSNTPLTTTGSASPLTVTGLANGTAYICAVTATNWAGTSDPSPAVSVTPRTVPGAPTVGKVTAGNSAVTVNFIAPGDNGGAPITGFIVTSAPGGNVAFGGSSPITVSGLSNGTAYTFTVAARNVAGTGAASAASSSVAPLPLPAAPAISSISISQSGDGYAIFTIAAPANTGGSPITAYTVSCGTLVGIGGSPVVFGGIANGVAFSCKVSASSAVGTGPATTTTFTGFVQSGTRTGVPSAPSITNVSVQSGAAIISFNAPSSTGYGAITRYAAACGGVTASGSASPITVSGLTDGTSYDCTVTAFNEVMGAGIASSAAKATPSAGVSVAVAAGWNLLGNGGGTPLDIATSFGDATYVTTVWKWNATTARWAFFAPSLSNAELAAYQVTKGYDALTTLSGGEGFWVNAAKSFDIRIPTGTNIVAGDFAAAASKALPQGWSLFALGEAMTPSQFNLALGATPSSTGTVPLNLTTLWAWDTAQSNWYFYAPSLEAQGATALSGYIASKGYLDFTANNKTLGPGVGFWVNRP